MKEIRIRDLINDADPNANPCRLERMVIIKTDPVVCISEDHFKSLSAKLKDIDSEEHVQNEYGATLQR